MNSAIPSERHWLQQPRSKTLFALSAGISGFLLVLGVIANVMLSYRGDLFIQDGTAYKILGTVVGVIGASSALYLWIGMAWYWFRLDRSASSMKKLWFVVLLLLNWVGAVAYYFAVYRRSASAGALQ